MTLNYNNQFLKDQSAKDSVGKEISSYAQTFDDKNHVIESTYKEIKTDSTKKDSTVTTVTKYSYDTFDDKGNWTQRTEMDKDGKRSKIVKRTITYYKD
jgi:predicted metallo-beta-lactamase superfamily hydrolase